MDDAFRMNVYLNLIWSNVKKPSGFDDFQSLVHHCGRINSYLAAHGPLRMIQSLLQSYILQVFNRIIFKRAP